MRKTDPKICYKVEACRWGNRRTKKYKYKGTIVPFAKEKEL